MSQISSLNDISSCTHIVEYYFPSLGFIDTPRLHAPVGTNRDFGTAQVHLASTAQLGL